MHPRTVHIEIGVAESEADRGIGSFRHGSCGLSFGPLDLRSGMPSQRWFASATGYHAREVITHERKAGVQLVSVEISNVGGQGRIIPVFAGLIAGGPPLALPFRCDRLVCGDVRRTTKSQI